MSNTENIHAARMAKVAELKRHNDSLSAGHPLRHVLSWWIATIACEITFDDMSRPGAM